MFHILVADDDKNTRRLMQAVLEGDGYTVTTACDGEEALAVMDREHIDLVVLDIMMPNMDGYEFTKTLRSANNEMPILMVSAKQLSEDRKKGFLVGTDDYMTKPFNILEVKARIKAIMRRVSKRDKNQENEKVIVKGEMKIDCESRRVIIGEKEINLTAKEFDLLELLAMNPGKVYSRENLLNIVWGYEYPGDARTVDVHIRRLREKIETNPSDPKYVYTKWGVGYYFQG